VSEVTEKEQRYLRDKSRAVASLVHLVKMRRFNDGAIVEALIEVADYWSYIGLSARERREMQRRLLKYVVALG
jgi:hypothetical protein